MMLIEFAAQHGLLRVTRKLRCQLGAIVVTTRAHRFPLACLIKTHYSVERYPILLIVTTNTTGPRQTRC
jgi:hypothetical protein